MRFARLLGKAFLILSLTALASAVAADPGDDAYQPEFTSWGTPDIGGTWDFRSLVPLERPADLGTKAYLTPQEARERREAALAATRDDSRPDDPALDVEGAYDNFYLDRASEEDDNLQTSLIVDPPDGQLPDLTPEARASMEAQNRSRTPPVRDYFSYSADPAKFRPAGPEHLGLSERCLIGFNAGPPIMPSAYNNNLRIVQSPNHVVLMTEMIHDARIVRMNADEHLPDEMRLWLGDSIGHWDGNTLVVETTNFTDKTPTFQLPVVVTDPSRSGAVGNGSKLHLVERFTPVEPGRLLYEFTITDPSTFVRPFTVRYPMRKTDMRIYEYACHEGNYAMGNILRGARLQEAEEAGEASAEDY